VQGTGTSRANPELKALVLEASRALAALDTARLEELALSCEALNRNLALENTDTEMRKEMARQAREAGADMGAFGRMLEATRGNLNVINRLREMRMGVLEYKVPAGRAARKVERAEGQAGDRMGGVDGNH
jgi:thymidine phosphorylase